MRKQIGALWVFWERYPFFRPPPGLLPLSAPRIESASRISAGVLRIRKEESPEDVRIFEALRCEA